MSVNLPASAFDQLGPHLLGRVPSPRDSRDWQMRDFLLPPADDSLLAKTVQQVLDERTYFASWPGVLMFWQWAKHHQPAVPGPAPAPPPGPGSAHAWQDNIQLDQGQTNHCVGFGWAAWGDCAPVEDTYQNADGNAIYYQCKTVDGQPGLENGSSVRSGAKVMQGRGRLGAYVFGSTTGDIKQWVTSHGPVVIGSDWTQDMFQPDADGIVRPTGLVKGGHCYLLLGYDPDTDLFEFDNSWGTSWGVGGRFFMSAADFDALVVQTPNGEACAGLELPVSPQPSPAPAPEPVPPPGPQPPADAQLDSVYHNYRLQVLHTSQELTGIVSAVRGEADGDTHIEVIPDPAYATLAFGDQNYVVIEPMPGQNIPAPDVGDHVHVVGTHVYDTNHAHNEIHPVLTWNGASYPPVVPPLFSGRFPNAAGPYALSEEDLNAEIQRFPGS
jgi:Papain family cysteine protease